MKLCFNNILYAFSDALDCVERDYFKTTSFHGKRVAYLCLLMGKKLQLNDQQMSDLVGCAILHDNGLTEYYKYEDNASDQEILKIHCVVGEENISAIPFFEDVKNVIKYHHELPNGQGPFHQLSKDTPLYSQLIHIADWVDIQYDFNHMNQLEFIEMIEKVKSLENKIFTSHIIDIFIHSITYEDIIIAKNNLNQLLKENVHNIYHDFSTSQMLRICQLFARIIDSKSPHTKMHSIGVATKVSQMALYYGCDEEMTLNLFFAGAMHDIGKLVIDRDILEKPAQLTDQEYTYMQTHAYYTYKILSEMDLGDIVHWSSFHHEKLDGSGYPFGKVASELDFYDRLMACCDIYQALTERRPYKEALSHEKSIEIMRNMVSMNKIDGRIVDDMNQVFTS